MKKKYKPQYGEVSYWESMSDLLIGLLLCFLLIALLLILYLIRIPDEEYVDDRYGDSYADYYDPHHGGGNYGYRDPDDGNDGKYDEYDPDDDDGGGGGWGWGGGADPDPGAYETPGEYDDPDPGMGEGLGMDKAAVYVQVIDGETERAVRYKGMEYELYAADDTLQTLHLYYPQRIDYTRYETTEDGVFFLPEKIYSGRYYLRDLTLLQGYDIVGKTEFTIEEAHDWDDPFVVTIALFPSRGTIRVQLKDKETGRSLSGAAFNVVAAEDIVTQGGATRYVANQLVDTIILDDNGYGESIPLYLGQYRLEQTVIPETYAALETTPTVTVQKHSEDVKQSITELSEQKTTVNFSLVDALYTAKGVPGAVFTLTSGDGVTSRQMTTDANGRIALKDLKANTTYYLQQISAPGSYEMDSVERAVSVDSRGCIDGSAVSELTMTNGIVRVSIGVQDRLLRGPVSDVNVALYDADGTLVKTWNTTALEQVLEGLAPGEYQVVMNGRAIGSKTIIVRQTYKMQSFYLSTWTTEAIGTLVITGVVLALLGTLIVYLLLKKRKAKREQEQNRADEAAP